MYRNNDFKLPSHTSHTLAHFPKSKVMSKHIFSFCLSGALHSLEREFYGIFMTISIKMLIRQTISSLSGIQAKDRTPNGPESLITARFWRLTNVRFIVAVHSKTLSIRGLCKFREFL